MPGVQTTLPLMLHYVNLGILSLERLVDLFSHGPNRIFGISKKGRIAVGYNADFAIVDLKKRYTIENKDMATKCGWTPYDGLEVMGAVIGTIIRGSVAMWEGELPNQATGQPVKFIGV